MAKQQLTKEINEKIKHEKEIIKFIEDCIAETKPSHRESIQNMLNKIDTHRAKIIVYENLLEIIKNK